MYIWDSLKFIVIDFMKNFNVLTALIKTKTANSVSKPANLYAQSTLATLISNFLSEGTQ